MLAAIGLLAGGVIVWAGGQVGPPPGALAGVSWWGTFAPVRTQSTWPGITVLGGVAVLIAAWLATLTLAQRRHWSIRRIWLLVGVWASPFAVGPPILSNDAYSYVAQGLMVIEGRSAYSSGPSVLGQSPALAAVDPRWRDTPSPYGPLATAVQSVAAHVGGASELVSIIVLRIVAIGSMVAIGVFAASLAAPHGRSALAVALTVGNPLLLLQFLGAAHLDGLMCALLMGALVAARRGQLDAGVALGCAAAAVKAPAMAVVVVIVAMACADVPSGRQRRRLLVRTVALAASVLAGLALLVPDGWGWVGALTTPGRADTAWAPADVIGIVLHAGVGWLPASAVVLSALGRTAALVAAGALAWWLLATLRRRLVADTTGGLLLTAALGPVVYPWYLGWGLVCLAPGASRQSQGWLVAVSAVGCLASVPALSHPVAMSVAVAAGMAVCAFGAHNSGVTRAMVPGVIRSSEPARSR